MKYNYVYDFLVDLFKLLLMSAVFFLFFMFSSGKAETFNIPSLHDPIKIFFIAIGFVILLPLLTRFRYKTIESWAKENNMVINDIERCGLLRCTNLISHFAGDYYKVVLINSNGCKRIAKLKFGFGSQSIKNVVWLKDDK